MEIYNIFCLPIYLDPKFQPFERQKEN